MEKMPPVSVPQGVLRYFRFRESRSIDGVAWRRDGISVTLGMRERRLIGRSSHNLWNVERVGAGCYRSTGGDSKVRWTYENQI